jgi:hypothetical protein
MSFQKDINTAIPVGDLQFYDNYLPALEAGSYYISVNQQLTSKGAIVNKDKIGTTQEFLVSAPQFTIDASQIINRYPPAGSSGKYGKVLPHIVLKDPVLPWERLLSTKGTPWLSLLVFTEDELNDGQSYADKSSSITINDFLKTKAPTLITSIKKADDIDGTTTCRFINIPVNKFKEVAPRLDELPYLSHIRKINTGNRPIMGLNEKGLFSVITSNRFSNAPALNAHPKPVKNIVHLVSLEGLEKYLSPNADFNKYTSVSLITMASWTFLNIPEDGLDFNALVTNLAQLDQNNTKADPLKLWLRLPIPAKGSGTGMIEVKKRIENGYVPLSYHTRSAENTFAWYRGPLAPVLPKINKPTTPYLTSDAAMIFDKTNGVFDASLAVAWESGREAALADSDFMKKLLDFRKQNNSTLDKLIHRDSSRHFGNKNPDTTIQKNFMELLKSSFIRQIGEVAEKRHIPKDQVIRNTPPNKSIDTFIEEAPVQKKLKQIAAKTASPIADWLARFALLYPLPFDKLVADERMLPVESIRFFFIDMNWINAGIDGALSLGIDSDLQSSFNGILKDDIQKAIMNAIPEIRAQLLGTNNPGTPPAIMSGFLLRSALVAGWPNLSIKAQDPKDKSLKIIRLDHLSPNVLLCIFDGVPNNIEFCEPQETLGFGVDDGGNFVLREILKKNAIGNQIEPVKIRDFTGKQKLCMRSAGSNVLNISPSESSGLIQTITKALTQKGNKPPNGKLTAATLAIQMIKSAEAIVFKSQTTLKNQ